jgi:hypothetical protein
MARDYRDGVGDLSSFDEGALEGSSSSDPLSFPENGNGVRNPECYYSVLQAMESAERHMLMQRVGCTSLWLGFYLLIVVFGLFIPGVEMIDMCGLGGLLLGLLFFAVLALWVTYWGRRIKWLGPTVWALLLLAYVSGAAFRGQKWIVLAGQYPGYALVVRRVLEEPERDWEREFLGKVKVDRTGGVTRVAFSRGGILDNWSAVVYDPSRELDKVNRSAPFWAHGRLPVTDLFGGDLLVANHLSGPWYSCGFT